MDFQAPTLRWQFPDVARYQELKQLRVIPRTHDAPFSPDPIGRPPMLTDPHLLAGAWEAFYGPRLAAAASGQREAPFPARFPGHTLPAPGNGTMYVGSLSIARFCYTLGLLGMHRQPTDLNGHAYTPLVQRLSNTDSWHWSVDPVTLQQVVFDDGKPKRSMSAGEKTRYLAWLQSLMVERGEFNPTGKTIAALLSTIRRAWGWSLPISEVDDERAAGWITDAYRRCGQFVDWLALMFEIEAILSEIAASRSFPLQGYGFFDGRWLEVAIAPIASIRSTELAVFDRVHAELFTLSERGFAPIVINELYCDTDGTHRLTAVWVWNILREACLLEGDPLDQNGLNRASRIIANSAVVDPIAFHEALQYLGQMLESLDGRCDVRRLLPIIRSSRSVTHLPVIFLPEYSWPTVVKGPFDDGTGSIRVDPATYLFLRQHARGVLPPRGPYHRTDRALLPVFPILQPT